MLKMRFPRSPSVLSLDKSARLLMFLFSVVIFVHPLHTTEFIGDTECHVGTKFSFVIMDNSINNQSASIILKIINVEKHETYYRIHSSNYNNGGRITASSSVLHYLPFELVMKGPNLASKTINLEIMTYQLSSSAIVYLFVNGTDASDSTLILPESALGDKYYVLTYCEIFGICQVAIASDSSTNVNTIRIQLPIADDVKVYFQNKEYTSGQSINVELHNKESVQLQCKCDLSGTLIESNGNNIAVFAGSAGTVVGVGGKVDFLFEQMIPISAWGKEYIVYASPLKQTGDFIRIIASIRNTVVRISGYKTVRLTKPGDFIHRRINSGSGIYIRANKPVMIVQFTHNGLLNDTQISDPSMFIVQPYEQYMRTCIFDTFLEGLGNYHLALFTHLQHGVSDISIDGIRVDQPTTIVQEKGIAIEFIRIDSPGRHIITSKFSFGGYLLMNFDERTFGQLIGTLMNNISLTQKPMVPGDEVDNDNDGMIDEDKCDESSLCEFSNQTLTLFRTNLISTESSSKDCGKIKGTSSNNGTTFLLAFPGTNTAKIILYVTTTTRTIITYSSTAMGNDYNENTEILKESGEIIMSGSVFQQEMFETGIYNNTVLLKSTENITIHASYESADLAYLYLALPVNELGLEYFAATDIDSSIISIAAAYDETDVFIHLPDMYGGELVFNGHSYYDFEVINVKIQQFQIIHLRYSDIDLTGTYIRASNPIAVFSGADDFLEQLFPVEYFGYRFVLPKLNETFTNIIIRIVASESNTVCSTKQSNRYEIFHNISNAGGKFDQTYISLTNRYKIECLKPVQITLFAKNEDNRGFMTNVIPFQQYKKHYRFYVQINNGVLHYSVHRYRNQSVFLSIFNGNLEERQTEYRFTQSYQNPGSVYILLEYKFWNESFSAYMFMEQLNSYGQQNLLTQGSVAGMKLRIKSTACKPSENVINDKIDNDCDGLVDEDICVRDIYNYDPKTYINEGVYIPDFDNDGSLDEDCTTQIPVPTSSSMNNESLDTSTNNTQSPSDTHTNDNQSTISSIVTGTNPYEFISSSSGSQSMPISTENMTDSSLHSLVTFSDNILSSSSNMDNMVITSTISTFLNGIQSTISLIESMEYTNSYSIGISTDATKLVSSIGNINVASKYSFVSPSSDIYSTVSITDSMKHTSPYNFVSPTVTSPYDFVSPTDISPYDFVSPTISTFLNGIQSTISLIESMEYTNSYSIGISTDATKLVSSIGNINVASKYSFVSPSSNIYSTVSITDSMKHTSPYNFVSPTVTSPYDFVSPADISPYNFVSPSDTSPLYFVSSTDKSIYSFVTLSNDILLSTNDADIVTDTGTYLFPAPSIGIQSSPNVANSMEVTTSYSIAISSSEIQLVGSTENMMHTSEFLYVTSSIHDQPTVSVTESMTGTGALSFVTSTYDTHSGFRMKTGLSDIQNKYIRSTVSMNLGLSSDTHTNDNQSTISSIVTDTNPYEFVSSSSGSQSMSISTENMTDSSLHSFVTFSDNILSSSSNMDNMVGTSTISTFLNGIQSTISLIESMEYTNSIGISTDATKLLSSIGNINDVSKFLFVSPSSDIYSTVSITDSMKHTSPYTFVSPTVTSPYDFVSPTDISPYNFVSPSDTSPYHFVSSTDKSIYSFVTLSNDILLSTNDADIVTDTGTYLFPAPSIGIQSSPNVANSMEVTTSYSIAISSSEIQLVGSTENMMHTSEFLYVTSSIHDQPTVSVTESMTGTGPLSFVTSTYDTHSTEIQQSITSQSIWATSSILYSSTCSCPCSKVQAHAKYQNLTEEKLESIIQEIKKELVVPKANLSSLRRKKTSARDDRPTSIGIGYIGLVFLIIVFGVLVLSDITSLYRHIQMMRDNSV